MKKKNSYKPFDDEVELLIKYAKGNTSEEESVKVRKALKKDEQLRSDLYFLINSFYGVYEEEVCPSISFLTNYYFDRDNVPSVIVESLEDHIETCDDCANEIEKIKDFDAETESIVENNLNRIASKEPETVMGILRKLSEQYLDSDLGDKLLDEIENIEVTPNEGVFQGGLALTGDVSGELTSKEREYEEILKKLLPEKEEINALIKEGNEDKLRKKLLDILDNEKKVNKIINIYNE